MILLNRGGVLNVPNVSFVDEDSSVRYLVDIKIEYKYVDLGLPSGLKWATCNVGASSPEEYGLYFAWGETTGYTGEQVPGIRKFTEEEYNAGPAASISTNITLEQDAAYVNMGSNWRMPTIDEFRELIDNCNIVSTDNYNGTRVAGKVFTSKINGNSLFLPNTGKVYDSSRSDVGLYGYYWSASCYSTGAAYFLYSDTFNYGYGSNGYSVRGVCE